MAVNLSRFFSNRALCLFSQKARYRTKPPNTALFPRRKARSFSGKVPAHSVNMNLVSLQAPGAKQVVPLRHFAQQIFLVAQIDLHLAIGITLTRYLWAVWFHLRPFLQLCTEYSQPLASKAPASHIRILSLGSRS